MAELTTEAQLVSELRRQNGTPAEAFEDADLLRITLDALAADFALCTSFERDTYPQLTMPIFAFAGRDDDIDEGALASWAVESVAETKCEFFEGGHFFIKEHEPQFVETLAVHLRSILG